MLNRVIDVLDCDKERGGVLIRGSDRGVDDGTDERETVVNGRLDGLKTENCSDVLNATCLLLVLGTGENAISLRLRLNGGLTAEYTATVPWFPSKSAFLVTPFDAEYTGKYAMGVTPAKVDGTTFGGRANEYTGNRLDPTTTLLGLYIKGISPLVPITANPCVPYTGANMLTPPGITNCANPVAFSVDPALNTGKYPMGNGMVPAYIGVYPTNTGVLGVVVTDGREIEAGVDNGVPLVGVDSRGDVKFAAHARAIKTKSKITRINTVQVIKPFI